MNVLFFHLPDNGSGVLKQLVELIFFINHEQYDAYWDENKFRQLMPKDCGEDRLMHNQLRNKFVCFTDYSFLAKVPEGSVVYCHKNDVSKEIEGVYAYWYGEDNDSILITDDLVGVPVAIFEDNVQKAFFRLNALNFDIKQINRWFAECRSVGRVFNHKAGKHREEEYKRGDKVVSPLNLDEAEVDELLNYAVGCAGESRLLNLHVGSSRLIVFSREQQYEDGRFPVYHGHMIKLEDNSEVKRLPNDFIKKLRLLYPEIRI